MGIKIMTNTQLTHLVYADDQVLLAPTDDDLQRAVTGLNYILKVHIFKYWKAKQKQWDCKENIGEKLKL